MTSLQEIRSMMIKRKLIKENLSNISTFARSFKAGDNINGLKNRLDEMTVLRQNFEEQTFKLIAQVDSDDDAATEKSESARAEIDQLSQFQSQWHAVLSEIQALIQLNTPVITREVIEKDPGSTNQQFSLRLPNITLPKFSGDYADWSPFHESFQSLVDKNPNLDNCQKLHFLRSCLQGEALRTISALSISGANYEIAWDILKKRYKNTRLIVQNHVNAIINAPEIGKCSAHALRGLVDDVKANLEALKVLKVPVQSWDALLIPLIVGKLDFYSRKEYEAILTTEIPKLNELIEFLEKKCVTMESMNAPKLTVKPPTPNAKQTSSRLSNVVTKNTKSKYSCFFCNKPHFVSNCPDLLRLGIPQRIEQVKARQLCENCLRSGHTLNDCRSTGCRKCQLQHHTLLHIESDNTGIDNHAVNCVHVNKRQNQVILPTATVAVKGRDGTYKECRVLLDSGSQLNLITDAFCRDLGLIAKQSEVIITGVNLVNNAVNRNVDVTIKSTRNRFQTIIKCFILENITTNVPTSSFTRKSLKLPTNIELADEKFNVSGPVEILLGAGVFWNLLSTGHIKIPNSELYVHNSKLGYLVGGELFNAPLNTNHASCNLSVKEHTDLKPVLERFWVQEEVHHDRELLQSEEEIQCEEQFKNSYYRHPETGRFCVQLPLKSIPPDLGDSNEIALRRFLSLEKRFARDNELKKIYSNAIRQNIDLGFLESVTETHADQPVFYLPHSGVVKPSRASTKIRIVYDGSSKSDNGLSLNDNLLTGPNLQVDLFDTVVRFRSYVYAVTCDMEKMFLQIEVAKEHRDLQRMYWRFSEQENVQTYRLTRLVFGLTNSPFTAMRVIRELAFEHRERFPEASRVLTEDVYMDDILTGGQSIEEVTKLCEDLVTVLRSGCFNLSKWRSSDPRILPTAEINDTESSRLEFGERDGTAVKVLGLLWDPAKDVFKIAVENPTLTSQTTKREVLSFIARLFDPVGFISPVIVKAKIIMQHLCTLGLGWDEPIPRDVKAVWDAFLTKLVDLNHFEIPRSLWPKATIGLELAAFADASIKAYGASVYVRAELSSGKYFTRIVCSKTRVSPLKPLTLPRLELCAALLAAQLMDRVCKAFATQLRAKHYFSDSMIVLHYINSDPRNYQTFVSNRIAKIQSLSEAREWRHVEGKSNPADIVSRGAYPDQLDDLFREGPIFLKQPRSNWPESVIKLGDKDGIPETRKITLVVTIEDDSILRKFSSFSKLVRIFALCQRFIYNLKSEKAGRRHGPLKVFELRAAEVRILERTQSESFQSEKDALTAARALDGKSKLLSLSPFVDSQGLLRVGGRLRHSSLPKNRKFPIVLPAGNHVTKLIIEQEHRLQLHAGPNQTLAAIRVKYWPLKAKQSVRKTIHLCKQCIRESPKPFGQRMGDIPCDRLQPCRPFLKVGLDYFGPLQVKYGDRRSKKIAKAWAALFVCMVTRAVHLELVSDLTTECFLNAMKRVVARRGIISKIYCDNATTFVGAKHELAEIQKFFNDNGDEIQTKLSSTGTEWNFIPPRAPNFGGLWERLVRSAKSHFKKVTQGAVLTFEEATTLLSQIEAVINSRPLTPLSNDPSELEVLTPAHFLVGESLFSMPEVDLSDVPLGRLNRWQRVQKMQQAFWSRWSREVLSQMQERHKWRSEVTNPLLKPGTLVLIIDDNSPPLVWKTALIEKVIFGADGQVRVADVRTADGKLFRRAVRKLAPLPFADGAANE